MVHGQRLNRTMIVKYTHTHTGTQNVKKRKKHLYQLLSEHYEYNNTREKKMNRHFGRARVFLVRLVRFKKKNIKRDVDICVNCDGLDQCF